MKLILFSGFLGSGKTTAILSAARFLTRGTAAGVRLVIIENEVGESGIDDLLLEQAGYEVKSLLSGCICCTLSADLVTLLKQIAQDHAPEYVVFEPSGTAWPGRVVESVRQYCPEVGEIYQVALADAGRWGRIHTVSPALAEAQLAGADVVLLNKYDTAGPEVLDGLEAELRALNPNAPLERVSARDGIADGVWQRMVDTLGA